MDRYADVVVDRPPTIPPSRFLGDTSKDQGYNNAPVRSKELRKQLLPHSTTEGGSRSEDVAHSESSYPRGGGRRG